MIKREIESVCKELFAKFPVLTITGPRQSGKTTLARNLFPEKPYVNLEAPDIRRVALEDPRGFLSRYPDGAVFDEIQRTPEMPSYLQAIVDETGRKGLFVLTGSQQLEVSQNISQSLTGRTALVKLLPFTIEELSACEKPEVLDKVLTGGFYPGRCTGDIPPERYYSNYLETYVERDVRHLSQIDNLHLFEKFLRLLASRVSSLVNASSLVNDCGVSVPTIQKWISILEASYIVFLLQPFFCNIGKRLIKTPKVYFYDTGLLCFLLGIDQYSHCASHPLRGAIFENMVVIDFLKKRFNQGHRSNLYFFRDKTGNEVDLLLDGGLRMVPVEIKSSQTPSMEFFKELRWFRKIFPDQTKEAYVVYDGPDNAGAGPEYFVNWRTSSRIMEQAMQ